MSHRHILPAQADVLASPIKDIERRVARAPGALSLAQGQAPFAPPDAVVEALRAALGDTESWRYTPPEGLLSLREAIAQEVAADGTPYDPLSEVVVTCGATEAVSAALIALLEPGDDVLVPTPAYVTFGAAISLARASARRVPLASSHGRYRLDFDALRAAVTSRTRAIVLANPSNPTGFVLGLEDMSDLCRLAEEHDLTVILDEVYRHTVLEGRHVSPGLLPETKARFVRVFGFGKTYGMCGLRVGYVLAPAGIARQVLTAHDALVNSAPHPAQLAALAALETCSATRDGLAERLKPLRAAALGGLAALSEVFEVAAPPATYFLFPRLRATVHDEVFTDDLFEATRVALVPGSAFGAGGEGHVRLSYASSAERIDQAFQRLNDHFLDPSPAGSSQHPALSLSF